MKAGDLVIPRIKYNTKRVLDHVLFYPFIPERNTVCTVKQIVDAREGKEGMYLEEVSVFTVDTLEPLVFDTREWEIYDDKITSGDIHDLLNKIFK